MNSYVLSSIVVLVVIMTVGFSTPASAQTFQYSRGWTNGKRSGVLYEANLIDRLLSNPCQLEKLRYILQGKPLNEKIMVPCDFMSMGAAENEVEPSGVRLRRSAGYSDRSQSDHNMV